PLQLVFVISLATVSRPGVKVFDWNHYRTAITGSDRLLLGHLSLLLVAYVLKKERNVFRPHAELIVLRDHVVYNLFLFPSKCRLPDKDSRTWILMPTSKIGVTSFMKTFHQFALLMCL